MGWWAINLGYNPDQYTQNTARDECYIALPSIDNEESDVRNHYYLPPSTLDCPWLDKSKAKHAITSIIIASRPSLFLFCDNTVTLPVHESSPASIQKIERSLLSSDQDA
ncbi:hypothetical protein FPOAC2_08196 [Fusarium poae]